MNICFFTNQHVSKFRGGVESVTFRLSEEIGKRRHIVYLLSAMGPIGNDQMLERQFTLPNSTINSPENQSYTSAFLTDYEIDIIINQSEVRAILELIKSSSLKTPVISVIHTDPAAAIKSVQDNWDFWKLQYSPIKFTLLSPYLYIKKLYQIYTRKKYSKEKYQYYYNQSNALVLLSEKFFKSFKKLSRITDTNKLYAICNPHTAETKRNNKIKKENIVLFVGRLVFQKRLDRLFRIWNKVKDKRDWKLIIVGDGADRNFYETLCRKWSVENIEFAGQCDPRDFYQKAKILCMTSSYEGSPCVLQEAIQNSVVPITFKSFESVTDIVVNGENGYLIKPFSIKGYSLTLESLMHIENRRDCIDINKQYYLETEKIFQQWEKLFYSLTN